MYSICQSEKDISSFKYIYIFRPICRQIFCKKKIRQKIDRNKNIIVKYVKYMYICMGVCVCKISKLKKANITSYTYTQANIHAQ